MKKLRITEILSIIVSSTTLITVISGAFFWFHQTSMLPNRMENAEKRIDKLEAQLIENNTKTELIYQAVLEVRSVLLKK